jgi:serine acetyltransferase
LVKTLLIGSNSVVTKNVPEKSVMAGIPAKKLEMLLKDLNLMLLLIVKKNNEKYKK